MEEDTHRRGERTKKREAPPLIDGFYGRREKVFLRDPFSDEVEEEEEDPEGNDVRKMSEEEMEVLSKLTHYGRRDWDESRDLFVKSVFWSDSVRPLPPPPQGGGGGEEATTAAITTNKSIVIQVRMYDERDKHLWFEVTVKDLLDDDQVSSCRSLLLRKCKFEFEGPLRRAFLFPPDRIITFDGADTYLSGPSLTKVACYNLVTYDDGTKGAVKGEELPDMGAARSFPRAVYVDGKIYVHGRLRRTSGDSYVEVYDPKEDKLQWKSINYGYIPPPLCRELSGGFVVDGDGRKHLLFHTAPDCFFPRHPQSLCTFDLETGVINFAESPFPVFQTSVVVNGFIYALLRRTVDIRVYDLAKKKWMAHPVSGLGTIPTETVYLRHIGGEVLCLIHEDYHRKHDPPTMEDIGVTWLLPLSITIFQVVHHGEDGTVEAKVIASRSCLIPYGAVSKDCIIF